MKQSLPWQQPSQTVELFSSRKRLFAFDLAGSGQDYFVFGECLIVLSSEFFVFHLFNGFFESCLIYLWILWVFFFYLLFYL